MKTVFAKIWSDIEHDLWNDIKPLSGANWWQVRNTLLHLRDTQVKNRIRRWIMQEEDVIR